MTRRIVLFGLICALASIPAASAPANNHDNPLTGTWECQSEGGPDGEVAFKLYLQQRGEDVNGSLMSSIGDAPLTYGSFKDNTLEIHIDLPEGTYILTAKLDNRTLSGNLIYGKDRGTWEGKKTWPAEK